MVKRYVKRRIIIFTTSLFLVVGASIGGYILAQHRIHRATIISKKILDVANFTIFYPADTTEASDSWLLQQDRTAYDKNSGVLTLRIVHSSDESRSVVLTEQSLPGVFTDVPTHYSKMLNSLNEYSELQTPFGDVALTHPKELNGGQAAVVNKAGTLMFAKPSASLTDDEWRGFFESLRILR